MSKKGAVGKIEMKREERHCPRDRAMMKKQQTGEATLDTCGKCGGTFFDSGEMFAAFGLAADPSYWDRPETGGTVRVGELECPVCDTHMLAQDVAYGGSHVEIDRCGHCGGLWLDAGEIQKIMTVSEKMAPVLEAEKAKARAELDAMGTPDFASPGLVRRFLALFGK